MAGVTPRLPPAMGAGKGRGPGGPPPPLPIGQRVLAHPLPGQAWTPFFGTVAGSAAASDGGWVYRLRISEYEAVDVVGAAVTPIPEAVDAGRISTQGGVA